MKTVQVGPLQAVITPPLQGAEVNQSVVVLHGYGAPGTDLVSLAGALSLPAGTQCIFPQAPQTLEGMSGPQAGRAWWHIDMLALQMARMSGEHETLSAQVPEGLGEAREALSLALNALEADHGLVWEQTYLGGFSQGAMLSCDWALRNDKPLRGLLQLSGTVICEKDWMTLMDRRAGLRVFQSHSPDDQVLPYSLAERLRDHMVAKQMQHTFVPFRGGHGIAPPVLEELSSFLR